MALSDAEVAGAWFARRARPRCGLRVTFFRVSQPTRVAHPPDKPLLIFDGDCNFCRRWILRWQRTTGEQVEYITLQTPRVAEQFPELTRDQLETAVHLIEPDGQVFRAAEAVFRALARGKRWPLWIYQKVPGARPVTEAGYRVVASHRQFFSRLSRLFMGAGPDVR